jgi:tetratricopeptide (TPR) repeat protein
MLKKIKPLALFGLIVVVVCGNAKGVEKYDNVLLKRQLEFYSPDKARELISKGEYTKAAINALSIYPISPEDSIRIALTIAHDINEPLPGYLFKAYREMGISSDPSVNLTKDGITVFDGEWVNQKAKWCDAFINEVRCYIRMRELFGSNKKAYDKFFFGGFIPYYSLDSNEAFFFAGDIKKDSIQYKVVNLYGNYATSREPVNIEELNKINFGKLSKAMKELVVIMKGDYYLTQKDYKKAKECYLEFFELDYSLPVHIENLAMCYMAEKNRAEAKSLYLHLTQLIQMNNISVGGIYNLACIWALEGNKKTSLDCLQQAIKLGFPKEDAKNDKDFNSLKDDSRFIELVK